MTSPVPVFLVPLGLLLLGLLLGLLTILESSLVAGMLGLGANEGTMLLKSLLEEKEVDPEVEPVPKVLLPADVEPPNLVPELVDEPKVLPVLPLEVDVEPPKLVEPKLLLLLLLELVEAKLLLLEVLPKLLLEPVEPKLLLEEVEPKLLVLPPTLGVKGPKPLPFPLLEEPWLEPWLLAL